MKGMLKLVWITLFLSLSNGFSLESQSRKSGLSIPGSLSLEQNVKTAQESRAGELEEPDLNLTRKKRNSLFEFFEMLYKRDPELAKKALIIGTYDLPKSYSTVRIGKMMKGEVLPQEQGAIPPSEHGRLPA